MFFAGFAASVGFPTHTWKGKVSQRIFRRVQSATLPLDATKSYTLDLKVTPTYTILLLQMSKGVYQYAASNRSPQMQQLLQFEKCLQKLLFNENTNQFDVELSNILWQVFKWILSSAGYTGLRVVYHILTDGLKTCWFWSLSGICKNKIEWQQPYTLTNVVIAQMSVSEVVKLCSVEQWSANIWSTWNRRRVTFFSIREVRWNSGFDFLPEWEKEKYKTHSL